MIAERHLRRRPPRKDRDVTWGRTHDLATGSTMWTLWRRNSRRGIHLICVVASDVQLEASPWSVAFNLRHGWRKLRDFVDEIDLAAMERRA